MDIANLIYTLLTELYLLVTQVVPSTNYALEV